MKKVYTPKTNQLSYIEYTDKELQEIKVLVNMVSDKEISCRVCNTHGNAIDINAKNEKV